MTHHRSEAIAANVVLVVDGARPIAPIRHVASGALYGVADAARPGRRALELLQPSNLTQMAPGGGQLPNGETVPTGGAIEVARLVADLGTSVTVRLPDVYPDFPYRWRGWSDWERRVTEVVTAIREAGVRNLYAYELWNEPNWTWDSAAGSFTDGWARTACLVRRLDPAARMLGPSLDRWDRSWMQTFLRSAVQRDVIPDVVSWHELDPADTDLEAHVVDYRQLESELGIEPRPISINEYGPHRDMAVPGALLGWIARLERADVETANIAFWHRPGRLSDLVLGDSLTGGGWLYRWYAKLEGQRVATTGSTGAAEILAAMDGDRLVALIGGAEGRTVVTIRVANPRSSWVGLERAPWTGTDGALAFPELVSDMTVEIGDHDVRVEFDADVLSAYRLVVEPTVGHRAPIAVAASFDRRYEAEDAEIVRGSIQRVDMAPHAFRSNRFSSDGYVNWLNEVDSQLTFTVSVPHSGEYLLTVGYATREAAVQRLRVDGVAIADVVYPVTQGDELVGRISIPVTISAGEHRISLAKQELPGAPAIDYLDVTGPAHDGRPWASS